MSSTWGWMAMMTFLCVLGMQAPLIRIITIDARPLGDDEIEAHLNRLNKPAVKSILLEDGDIVDCVDIYKQPAFDHPLLKNHKIVMQPSFWSESDATNNPGQDPIFESAWQKTEGCPDGTIPIRRIQKDDLIRSASLGGFGTKASSFNQVERAGGRAEQGPYFGARALINLWNVSVESDEWSHASIELSDGTPKTNFAEGGWMANPSLFGNADPRIFTYWTTDGYQSTGCFNLLCPGFVQVGKTYVLGVGLKPVSSYNGKQYAIDTYILRDNVKNVWWFVVQGETVGYWPMEIFVNNGGLWKATMIRWAGGVLNLAKGGKHTTTQMGSGHFADEGWAKAAVFQNLAVYIIKFVPPATGEVTAFSDRSGCYTALLDGGGDNTISYGGPGGPDC